MIQGTFDVSVDTPKLHRRGTLALQSEGEAIAARLTVSDLDPIDFAGTCADKTFHIEGSGDLPSLGQVDYTAEGEVWGNSIDVKCQTSAGTVTIFGTRLSGTAGDMKSSHEYMMRASKAECGRNDGTMYSGLYSDVG